MVYAAAPPTYRGLIWRFGAWTLPGPARPSASSSPEPGRVRPPWRHPATGWRSHGFRSTLISTASKSGVLCSWSLGRAVVEQEPRLSPDGRRLAFGSERPGEGEVIWVADADGSHPQQLTHGPGRSQGSPYWSPDGRRIVFDAFGDDGHVHIWIIDADGGSPRRLETQAGDERVPVWSRERTLDLLQQRSRGPPHATSGVCPRTVERPSD